MARGKERERERDRESTLDGPHVAAVMKVVEPIRHARRSLVAPKCHD